MSVSLKDIYVHESPRSNVKLNTHDVIAASSGNQDIRTTYEGPPAVAPEGEGGGRRERLGMDGGRLKPSWSQGTFSVNLYAVCLEYRSPVSECLHVPHIS